MQKVVERSLNKIADTLSRYPAPKGGLFSGALGQALFYSQLYVVYEDERCFRKCVDILSAEFGKINAGESTLEGASMAEGLSGFAWLVDFLNRRGFLNLDIDSEFDLLEEYLFNSAMAEIGVDFVDYIYGAFGPLFYFVQRGDAGKSLFYLEKLVDQVLQRVKAEGDGDWIRTAIIKTAQKGVMDIGLAHGQCGLLLILIKAGELLPHRKDLQQFVRAGVEGIVNLQGEVSYEQNKYNVFPFQYAEGRVIPAPNRLAWCYGDLTVVLLLYRASRYLGWSRLKELADIIGTQTLLRRELSATLITDSHFCHGSSGVAQLYQALYRESRLEAYKHGYEHWIEQTVLMADEELAGEYYRGRETDLLEGLTGVGLTLLSFVSYTELDWDRIVLLK